MEDIAESFVSKDLLSDAVRQGLPWEEWFSDPVHLREALQDAGLINVAVERREYRVTMSVADYLSNRETSLQGRFMRQVLDEAQWEQFRERVGGVPEQVSRSHRVHQQRTSCRRHQAIRVKKGGPMRRMS